MILQDARCNDKKTIKIYISVFTITSEFEITLIQKLQVSLIFDQAEHIRRVRYDILLFILLQSSKGFNLITEFRRFGWNGDQEIILFFRSKCRLGTIFPYRIHKYIQLPTLLKCNFEQILAKFWHIWHLICDVFIHVTLSLLLLLLSLCGIMYFSSMNSVRPNCLLTAFVRK